MRPRIRASGSSGHLQALECTVDGVPATAFMIRGGGPRRRVSRNATSACCLGEAQFRPVASENWHIRLIDITGGEFRKGAMVNKIQLTGSIDIIDCPLVIADFSSLHRLGNAVHKKARTLGDRE